VIDTVLLPKSDIVETAIADGRFTTLAAALGAADLVETLKGEGPFTVFAPTDAAFAAVPADVLEALAADPEALQSVLLYHVVPGRLIAALISDGKEVATAEGSNVLFSFADGVKQVNGATIVAKDIQASNGVIHVIDTVLLASALWLAWQLGRDAAPWIAAKVVALLLYIVLGSIALRRGRTPGIRIAAFFAALATFGYIVSVAIAKSPWGALARL